MSKTYPYTIDNGSGELLTFTGLTPGPGGERLGADGVAQPGAGPPMHVHYLQEEAARVVQDDSGIRCSVASRSSPVQVSSSSGLLAPRTSGGTQAATRCR